MHAWARPPPTPRPSSVASITVVYARVGPEFILGLTVGPNILGALVYIGIVTYSPGVDEYGTFSQRVNR